MPLDKVWETFKNKFGHYQPNEWHLGSKFGTDRTTANRQLWLDYLYEINPNAPEHWIKFHIELEFGLPGKEYKSRKGTHTPPQNQHVRQDWWKVLGVLPLADWADIKLAYRDLALKYHPDTSDLPADEAEARMKLINWAYEQAKSARKPASGTTPTASGKAIRIGSKVRVNTDPKYQTHGKKGIIYDILIEKGFPWYMVCLDVPDELHWLRQYQARAEWLELIG